MSLEGDVAEILTTVRWLEDTLRDMGFGGPRILPGDGGRTPAPQPVEPAPTPTQPPPSNPVGRTPVPSTPAIPRGPGPAPPSPTSGTALRDLSDTQGPAIVEGPAGTIADILCRRPAGTRVEITTGRVPSVFGACTSVEISVGSVRAQGRGSDATGSLTFLSTGNDVIRVTLNEAGGVNVHRSN